VGVKAGPTTASAVPTALGPSSEPAEAPERTRPVTGGGCWVTVTVTVTVGAGVGVGVGAGAASVASFADGLDSRAPSTVLAAAMRATTIALLRILRPGWHSPRPNLGPWVEGGIRPLLIPGTLSVFLPYCFDSLTPQMIFGLTKVVKPQVDGVYRYSIIVPLLAAISGMRG